MKLEDLKKIAAHFEHPVTPGNFAELQAYIQSLGLDPNSLYQELEMTGRFVQLHRDSSYSNAMLQLHSHTFFEILCCSNTCGAEYLVGTELYRLQKGDIIFVPPGVSHRPLLPDAMEEPYRRDVLWLTEEFVKALSDSFSDGRTHPVQSPGLLRTAGTKWEYLREMLHDAVKESEQQPTGWELSVTGKAITFMAHLKRAYTDTDTLTVSAEQPDLLEQVITYIENNLSQKITLPETAHHFYVSTSTISQTFRKKLGVSFYRFVTQRRLINAKVLIQNRTVLEDVAERSGFSDYSAFYRAFKQEYGISPRQYRTLQEQGRA